MKERLSRNLMFIQTIDPKSAKIIKNTKSLAKALTLSEQWLKNWGKNESKTNYGS